MFVILFIIIGCICIIYMIWQKSKPSNPPIDNTTEHMKKIMSLPNPATRQQWLKQQARQSYKSQVIASDTMISKTSNNDESIDRQKETAPSSDLELRIETPTTNEKEKSVAVTTKQVRNTYPTEGFVLDSIRKDLNALGFKSITVTSIPNNKGIWVGCFKGSDEYIFSCRSNSFDIENTQIRIPILYVFKNIYAGDLFEDDILSYYKKLFSGYGFNHISINIQNHSIILVTASYTGTPFSFKFIYPSMDSFALPNNDVAVTTNDYPVDIDFMDGHTFESFCAKVLLKNGFTNVAVTQGSGDQGIDVLATKDGIKYGIQCKCYNSDVGNKAVQEVFAGKTFYKCHVGAVLTNQYFTRSAIELAEANGVLLWDRKKLLEFMKNAGITAL